MRFTPCVSHEARELVIMRGGTRTLQTIPHRRPLGGEKPGPKPRSDATSSRSGTAVRS
jgi:hypothetical protein